MCGGSILSCCLRNPHGHERALKEEEDNDVWNYKQYGQLVAAINLLSGVAGEGASEDTRLGVKIFGEASTHLTQPFKNAVLL